MRTMKEITDFLVQKFNYKKLPKEDSDLLREKYKIFVKGFELGSCNKKIYSKTGILISNGYERIVIGDYGCYIEFSINQIVKQNIICQPGEEYRIYDDNYKTKVKYFWLTTKDKCGVKIYYQQKTVTYADYKINMFYVSPEEITIGD